METGRREQSPLQTGRGSTSIVDAVVTSIADMAVKEISGAEPEVEGTRIPGDKSPTMGELFGKVTGSARGTRGVSVEVNNTRTAIDLTVTVPYDRSIPEVIIAMCVNVIRRVEKLTSLEVSEVNITVKDIFFP